MKMSIFAGDPLHPGTCPLSLHTVYHHGSTSCIQYLYQAMHGRGVFPQRNQKIKKESPGTRVEATGLRKGLDQLTESIPR